MNDNRKIVKINAQQLSLLPEDYCELFGLERQPKGRFSSSMELYDALPKYYWGKQSRGKSLPSLRRHCRFRGHDLMIVIKPARLFNARTGEEYEAYAGKKEELVEDVLRKLAAEGRGMMLTDGLAATYSYYAIQQELARVGHKYSIAQIKEAIEICAGSQIQIIGEIGDEEFSRMSPMFKEVSQRSKSDWEKKGRDSVAMVQFHSLVTRSVQDLSFRQLDYETCMGYLDNLARQLHKRLSHFYTFASAGKPYEIGVRRIFEDCGMSVNAVVGKSYHRLCQALDEMCPQRDTGGKYIVDEQGNHVGNRVVLRYEIARKVPDPANPRKHYDIIVRIFPHPEFTSQMKLNNAHTNRVKMRACNLHHANTGEYPALESASAEEG